MYERARVLKLLSRAPMRDALYRCANRNRYRIFGKRETCCLPRSEDAHQSIV
jgi:predicted DCC family thiol-disulfide oxidoreductase YuxK